MNHCKETGFLPTDEAAAIERIGLFPMAVEAQHNNLKITYERDLKIAEVLCIE
jgi:2-C-methyl-D-erythritol 4-phosphate cytidylyltransferase